MSVSLLTVFCQIGTCFKILQVLNIDCNKKSIEDCIKLHDCLGATSCVCVCECGLPTWDSKDQKRVADTSS